ncbi:MAG: hypothetical protein LUH20_09720, partial [Lachnospiraceae bacterium]|nr:hypothetical protein [Lachnospiraceae bacterium]
MRRGKKTSRGGRLLAIVLAMAMVFQQAGIDTLADELYSSGTEVTETEAVSEAVEETTAATVEETTAAEETTAVEITAEETTAAETAAAEETADEAETAAEASEDETDAEASTEAETALTEESSEAETGDAEEAESESESEVESESESETEEETETEVYGTSFTYTGSNVEITATASTDAEIPEDAKLQVTYLKSNSDAYKNAVETIESQLGEQLGLNEDGAEAAYVLYDVSFVCNSEAVEPKDDVAVTVVYTDPMDLGIEGEITAKEVVLVDDSATAKIATDYISVSEDGEVAAFGSTQDSFTVIGVVVIAGEAEEETSSEAEEETEDGNDEKSEEEVVVTEAETEEETSQTEETTETEKSDSAQTEEMIATEETDLSTETTEDSTSEDESESETIETSLEETEEVTEALTEAQSVTEAESETSETEEESEEIAEDSTENVTEEETEKLVLLGSSAKKSSFSATSENITASVQLSESISADAQLVVETVADTYENAGSLATSFAGSAGITLSDYIVLDIHFEDGEGNEIDYSGSATVTLSFETPILDGDESTAAMVFHINGDEIEYLAPETDYTDSTTGVISGITFTTTSGFSPYVIGLGGYGVSAVSTSTSSDLSDFITGMDIYVDGTAVSSSSLVSPSTSFSFEIHFEETSTDLRMEQTMYMTMPNNLVNYPTSGSVYDDSGVVVGTYTVDSNGKVTITFTDEFMARADSGLISGTFKFSANISSSETGETVTITIPDTTISKEVYINRNPSLSANKTYSYDSDTGIITYTLTVTADNGDFTDVTLYDTISNYLTIVDSSGNASSSYSWVRSGITTHHGSFTGGTENTADNTTTYTIYIGSLTEGQTVTVTYYAKVSDEVLEKIRNGEITEVGNSLEASGKNKNEEKWSNDPSVDVVKEFKNETWFSKYSSGTTTVGDKTYLTWTVKYNVDAKESVYGNVVTDTIASNNYTNIAAGDTITVTRSDGVTFTITASADGTWSYEIGSNAADTYTSGKEYYTYTFEYKTEVDASALESLIGKVTITNSVEDDQGHSGSGTGNITGTATEPAKTADEITEDYVEWEVEITVPAGGMYIYLYDESYAYDPITYAVVKVDVDTDTIETSSNYSGNVIYQKTEDGKGYFFFGSDVSSSKTVVENKAASYIANDGNSEIKITITYQTTNKDAYYGTALADGSTVTNYISYNNWSTSATAVLPADIDVDKMQVGSYQTAYYDVSGTGEQYIWKTEDNYVTYCVVINGNRALDFGSEADVIVTDTHSTNMSYVSGSAKLMRTSNIYGSDWYGSAIQGTNGASWLDIVSASDSGGVLTINLGKLTGTYSDNKPYIYILYYQMEVDSTLVTSSDGTNLSNSVEVSAEEGAATGVDNVNYTYTSPLFTKALITSPVEDNQYTATFRITVSGNYKNTSNQLIINDACVNLNLDYTTLVVKKDGTEITDYTVAVTSSGMTITINNVVDSSTYVIEYQAKVTGAVGTEITYSNTATVSGYEDQYYKVENKVTKTQHAASTVNVSGYALEVYKYNNASATSGLAGAKFKITDASGNTLKDNITTGNDGMTTSIISLSQSVDGTVFQKYTLYYLVETDAPSGYTKLTDPIAFYFTTYELSASDLATKGLTDAIALYSDYDSTSTSNIIAYLEVGNSEQTDGSITVTKNVTYNNVADDVTE